MSYVIYNKETTVTLLAATRSVGCYIEFYKSAGAAKAALTRLDKKGMLGSYTHTNPDGNKFACIDVPLVKADFAIAQTQEFHDSIEKTVTRKCAMTGEEFEESINANFATSPASENYWCS